MANDKDFVVKNGLAVSGNIRVNGSSSGTATIAVSAAAGTPTLTLPTTTGTIALLQDKLSAFAATTSAELAGVISDETGSGVLVFATSPTLTTPTLGVASATSINKVTLTTPATGSTLTIADGKTLTASNTLTFTGTDSSSVAFGTGGTVAYTGSTLAQFAATTSSQLAGVISDETGSGALVFATSPTFTTSIVGSTGFTAFATSSTLTIGCDNNSASTTNIVTGAAIASRVKTINLGTGGLATSITNINIGTASGGTGTTTVNNDLIVTGNLTVNGTTTTVNSTTVTVDDPIFTLGGDTAPASDDNKDRGIEFRWHNGTAAKRGFFGFDDSTGYFTFIPDATNTSEVFSGTQGDIQATNFRGALIGNADTVTNGALTTGTLAQFAATTSSQLAGVISDETGTGALVFAVSPALTGTPTAPTASAGTNTTQIASTAFVQAAVAGTYITKTANYTAAAGDRILTDTSAGSFTITLPATPTTGQTVIVYDITDWETNNLTVARNGSTIEGVADDFVLDLGQIKVDFVYSGTTWQVYAAVGHAGPAGPAGSNGLDTPVSTTVALAIALG